MKILHLIHSEGVYGAELILLYLARELMTLGHEPIIGSIRDPGTASTDFEDMAVAWGLPVVRIRIAPRLTPGTIRSLLRTIRGMSPDLLHSHGYKPNILLGLLPRKWRGPMICTLHGWTYPRPFTALWLYQLVDRVCLRGLDQVVMVGHHMRQLTAMRSLSSRKCTVIENGIPSLQARLEDYSAMRVQPLPAAFADFVRRAPTIVAIGRLSPEKGFDVLIEAFAQTCSRGMRYQLAIVGEGPQQAQLEAQIAHLALADRVLMSGYVAGADRVLERAAGFVMSSFTEGLPLALLEAMQWRAPIVATTVGAIPDVLDHGAGGWLVAPGDAAALCNALLQLMSGSADAVQKSTVSLQRVSERYSSSRMAEEYANLYRRIVDANS
jgi:glycosyltransferase involved in cell wall biosynthesis